MERYHATSAQSSPLHSITSSARASSVGGTSRPSALAVLRYQHTGLGVLAECRDRRNAALAQCLRDGFTVAEKHRACWQNDRLAAGIVHCVKCATVVLLAFHLDHPRLQTQLTGRIGCRIALFTPEDSLLSHSGQSPAINATASRR